MRKIFPFHTVSKPRSDGQVTSFKNIVFIEARFPQPWIRAARRMRWRTIIAWLVKPRQGMHSKRSGIPFIAEGRAKGGPPPRPRTSHLQPQGYRLYQTELVADRLERAAGIEPASSAWKAEVIAIIRCPPIWWPLLGLNQRPIGYEPTALTAELKGRVP